jgi:hypothetical protein
MSTPEERAAFKESELRRVQELQGEFAGMVYPGQISVPLLAEALRKVYGPEFPRGTDEDWKSDADFIAARYSELLGSPADTLPQHTRLILVPEDLLATLGTRTERGERITAEWGEKHPSGWYEPIVTVHVDDVLGQFGILRAIYDDARGLDGVCRWCDAPPPDETHDHDVACPAAKAAHTLGLPGYRDWFGAAAELHRSAIVAAHRHPETT